MYFSFTVFAAILGLSNYVTANQNGLLGEDETQLEKRLFDSGSFFPTAAIVAARNALCTETSNSGGIVLDGTTPWQALNINNLLASYLVSNPPIDDWTGRFYRNDAAVNGNLPPNFSCLSPGPNCKATPGLCTNYKSPEAMLITTALGNLHRVLSAQIASYDRAIEIFNANNQELAKVLFRDTPLGRDRFTFDTNAFFTGFFIGVDLAVPGLGGVLTTAIKSAIKTGLKTVGKDLIKANVPFNVGSDPTNNGLPFVQSLRETYAPLQASLRNVMAAYMDTGNTDPTLQSTAADTVAFLRNGEFANFIQKTDKEMIEDAAREIVRLTAAPIIGGIWHEQGGRLSAVPGACNNALCPVQNCGPFRFTATMAERPFCLDIGFGFDVPETLAGTVARFGIDLNQAAMNAAQCQFDQRSGIFPPVKTDIVRFGFPACTFVLKKRDQ